MEDVKQNTLKEEKIRHFLKKNSGFEWQLSIYQELESTNDYLIEFANPNEYGLCLSESQTKGRGRNLKKWQSPKYENIYMSISFSTNHELKNFSSFSLVSALAVHNVLLKQNIFTEIKWPNDIYLNKKKIGGILIETLTRDAENLIIVGIGLNVNQVSFQLSKATSMKLQKGMEYAVEELLNTFIFTFRKNEHILFANNFLDLKERYLACLFALNEQRFFKSESKEFEGKIIGVDDSGQLLIESQGKQMAFQNKEIHFL